MTHLIEFLPAVVAIVTILSMIAFSVKDANKVDLDENKIESPKNHKL